MPDSSNAENIKHWSSYPQEFIAAFGEEGDFIRKYLLNPTMFSLLGDIQGKTMLDAGCGQGYLSRLLAQKGAKVTGVEPAQGFYDYAVQQEQATPLGITYLQADLSTWSGTPNSFDFVIANMVLMDIPDYLPALTQCVDALKPGGALLFSLLHPCFEESGAEWQHQGFVAVRDYFRERAVQQRYGYFIHRPLSTYLNSVIQAGCTLQQILEPQLDEQLAHSFNAERYHSVPGYLVIFATKNTAP